MSPLTTTITDVGEGGATSFSDVHSDILEAYILTRLDGPTVASVTCVSSQFSSLSAQDHLWTTICHSTWPSTSTPLLRNLISTFPGGARSFFSRSFPLILPNTPTSTTSPPPPELISAVDIHYNNKLIFTKVHETETLSGWFRCSPFRIDLLDPKEVINTAVHYPDDDGACDEIAEEMTLSWVLIDPFSRQAVNLSTHKPVSLHRHWLSGEVQVLFAWILPAGDRRGSTPEFVQYGIVVTCGGSERGEMQVREVSLQVEDMDGMHLTGKESLVILHKALEGKRGNKKREEVGRMRYIEYLEMKREKRQRKLRTEEALDMLCVAFAVTLFAASSLFFIFS